MLSRFLAAGNFFSGPGPTELDYDPVTDTGYYGVVSSDDLITGDALATQISLSAGSSENSTAGWLKFYVGASADCNVYGRDGGTPQVYVLFVAKKTLRYNLSWDAIDTAKAVDGSDAEITVDGLNYKVRLLTGADADPTTVTYPWACADNAGGGSEWNDLIYRVHTDTPNCTTVTEGMSLNEATQHGGAQVGDDWGSFADADLSIGRGSWVQEKSGEAPADAILRGSYGVAYFRNMTRSSNLVASAWRPVLELT